MNTNEHELATQAGTNTTGVMMVPHHPFPTAAAQEHQRWLLLGLIALLLVIAAIYGFRKSKVGGERF